MGCVLGPVAVRQQALDGFSEQFLPVVAENPLRLHVDPQDDAATVRNNNRVGYQLEEVVHSSLLPWKNREKKYGTAPDFFTASV